MGYQGYPFRLVELEPSSRASLYTVQFYGHDRTEFAKWANTESISTHDEFGTVYGAFTAIASEGFPDDCYFKRRKYDDYGWVTPFISGDYHPELRLYCIHRQKPEHKWVIAVNGCVKDGPGPLQDFPPCEFAFENTVYVHKCIRKRMETDGSPTLSSDGTSLVGDFEFS